MSYIIYVYIVHMNVALAQRGRKKNKQNSSAVNSVRNNFLLSERHLHRFAVIFLFSVVDILGCVILD